MARDGAWSHPWTRWPRRGDPLRPLSLVSPLPFPERCYRPDNNPVERAIRPIALGRKNHLFAVSDGGGARWATVCSLIATARLNDVEPFAYLKGVLERMTDGHPMSQLDELLPWNWPKTHVNH